MTDTEKIRKLVAKAKQVEELYRAHEKAASELQIMRAEMRGLMGRIGPVVVDNCMVRLDHDGIVYVIHGRTIDLIERMQFVGGDVDDKSIPF